MSINKLFAVLDCQPTTPNRLRGEARNGRRAIYVDRSRRPDGDLRDKPGCVPASGCTKGAPWRATRCIGADGSPVGGAQQRRPSPYLVSQEEKPSKSARGAGPPGTRKARRGGLRMCVRKNFGSIGFIALTRSSFLWIQNFYVYGNRAPVMRGSGEEAPGKRSGTGGGSIQWVVARAL